MYVGDVVCVFLVVCKHICLIVIIVVYVWLHACAPIYTYDCLPFFLAKSSCLPSFLLIVYVFKVYMIVCVRAFMAVHMVVCIWLFVNSYI